MRRIRTQTAARKVAGQPGGPEGISPTTAERSPECCPAGEAESGEDQSGEGQVRVTANRAAYVKSVIAFTMLVK